MNEDSWNQMHEHSIFMNAQILIKTVGGINHEVIGIETHGKIHVVKNTDGFIEIGNTKDELLGIIYKYKPWNKYVWEQDVGVILSESCLKDVQEYMKTLKEKHQPFKHLR